MIHSIEYRLVLHLSQLVRNIDARYTAFSVQQGEKLYLAPDDRVRIW